jgi:hypothetical protein
MPSSQYPKRPRSTSPRVVPSDELQQLHRGELTPNEYLQFRIEQATAHLRGRVSRRRLQRIRKLVIEACINDPVLRAMQERLLGSRR